MPATEKRSEEVENEEKMTAAMISAWIRWYVTNANFAEQNPIYKTLTKSDGTSEKVIDENLLGIAMDRSKKYLYRTLQHDSLLQVLYPESKNLHL